MKKEKLINALRQKGIANSLISLYYDIGRALPFRAQRFPDGRFSDWYKSQFVEVHSVKPEGKGGLYGRAYGFYFRDGVRVDSDDTPEYCWCKRSDTDPQEIPNSACGSWVLLDILGEPIADSVKILNLDDVLERGKHQGETVRQVVHNDWNWIKWAIEDSRYFYFDVEAISKEHESDVKVLKTTDVITFGKHKGKTIGEIAILDYGYLLWLKTNVANIIIDFDSLGSL